MRILQVIIALACLIGCGKEPAQISVAPPGAETPIEDSPTPTPAVATPTPSSIPATVVTFGFNNSNGICAAVRSWNPATTTIVFPQASGGALLYSFELAGVFIMNADGSGKDLVPTASIVKENVSSTVCTISVTAGALVGVSP